MYNPYDFSRHFDWFGFSGLNDYFYSDEIKDNKYIPSVPSMFNRSNFFVKLDIITGFKYKYDINGTDKTVLNKNINDISLIFVVNKKNNLEDFSKADLDNFEKMLMNSDRGAKYFNKRWYHSGYEATFLDLDNQLIITNDVRGVKDTATKILIFNVSGFIIIDKETNDIQVYFDESIAGKKVRDSLIAMLRYNYGNQLTILNSLDEIGEAERTILLQLRDNYVSKK